MLTLRHNQPRTHCLPLGQASRPALSTSVDSVPSQSGSRLLALIVVTAMVGLVGCSDSGPTEPDTLLVINGNVEHQSTSTENFVMTVDGLLEVTLDSITPQLPEGGVLPDTSLVIGFSLGRIVEDQCIASGALAMRPGNSASYGIDRGNYCFRIYDPGFIPEDASYDFSITAEMTDF